jgi:recombinational DNA repair protein RecT
MQLVPRYLVNDRIIVVSNDAGFVTEFRPVYSRTIKVYKGIDNTIQLDVRNSEQRKQTVVGQTAVIKFFDADQKNLFPKMFRKNY